MKYIFSNDCVSSLLYNKFRKEQISPLGHGLVTVKDFCSIFERQDWYDCLKKCEISDTTDYTHVGKEGHYRIMLGCSYKGFKFTLDKCHHTDFIAAKDEVVRRATRIGSDESDVLLFVTYKKTEPVEVDDLKRLNELGKRFKVIIKTYDACPHQDAFKNIKFMSYPSGPVDFINSKTKEEWAKILGWEM